MAPKRKLQEKGEPPKKKAPTFTEQEARKLIALYCEARERYHGTVRHEEAKVLLELRKVELARAKLELERLTAAVPGGTASTCTAPPSTYPYTYYNM
ncbi:hypothetical protein ANCCAN_22284 [Ancylostoma caninum]|uniref:Uncharacterized protein n=1 Tax=Ancylostoma caninum TaxID=29170 RepID=A0A368FI71_ANCCA|nr:hypothetical protein ANCCAN_22284 [Ancylostoma caninum]